MGSAISKRYQTKPASVLLLGLDSSGKSTLLYKLKDDLAVETSPTIGFNVEMLELDHKTTLTIWDIGGQDSMRPNWKHYLEDCDALVFVVDSADSSRLDQAKAVLRKIMKDDNMKGVPLLVLANKKELPQSLSIREISNKLELSSYEDTDWEIQACSAYTGLGLRQALLSLAKRIKER